MASIEIVGLSKSYGDVIALERVDMVVPEGEFLTILGPSGSGKTTLLLTIAGFEFPTEGNVVIDGKDVTYLPAHRRKIGLTFQSYALFPHMDVEGNVSYPLRVRHMARTQRESKVQDALRLVRLSGYERRRPHQLSGGQQQRVALARAIAFNPDILLLDEPLAALDRQLRQQVQVELRDLQRSLGVTTIAVTHDQEEALTMSDRILVLRDGTVQQHGYPEEVYRRPANSFVATFLGTANLFEGKIVARPEGTTLVWHATGTELQLGPTDREGPATAMLRPEQVVVRSGEGTEGYPGIVKNSVYLGASTRYRVDLGQGTLIEATQPGQREFLPGDRVRVDWRPEDIWILA